MKFAHLPLAVVCLLVGAIRCSPSTPVARNEVSHQLDSLLQTNEVFKARRLFTRHQHHLPQPDSLLFAAQLENTFNHAQTSNACIANLLQHYSTQLDDTVKSDLLQLKLQNHVRLFEYREAVTTSVELLENYGAYLDSLKRADLSNELAMWHALKDEPAQVLVKKEYSEIELASGSRIPTFFNRSKRGVDMIFDTGANMSVLIESLADSLNVKYVDGTVRVKGILGNEITAKIGIASTISFGNIELENVVLIVFPDSALYFEEADFQIHGITGYPVLAALGEIQRTQDNMLIIPTEASTSSYSNLALDFLTPVVEVIHGEDSLVFTFDTGADKTWLHKKYYDTNKDSIDGKHRKTSVTMGGAGAVHTYPVFLVDFPFSVGQSSATLTEIALFDSLINLEHQHYSGNLGQDAVKSFYSMTLNFDFMFIEFSNNQQQ